MKRLQQDHSHPLSAASHPCGEASCAARLGFIVSQVSKANFGVFEFETEYETIFFDGTQKSLNSGKCIAQQEAGTDCRAIANAQPDHLRQASTQNAQF